MSQIPDVGVATTYIASAAIKSAHIGSVNADTINAGIITGRTYRSSTDVAVGTTDKSGIIIQGDTLYVLDIDGTLRVKLGDLTGTINTGEL
jgi:hypothetical protein